MFKRRNKPKFHHRARNFLWPSLGWKRSAEYLFHRIGRLPGTSYSIAAGFACGVAISFTPFVGMHFLLAGLLAWIIRANVMAAVIGTAFGNPWTFPFIWALIYKLGVWMGAGGEGLHIDHHDIIKILASYWEAVLRLDFNYLLETAWPVVWPMFIGSFPAVIFFWLLVFLTLRPLIEGYQSKRRRRRMVKIIETKERNTEQ